MEEEMEVSSEASGLYWDAETGLSELVEEQQDLAGSPSSAKSGPSSLTHAWELRQSSSQAIDCSSQPPTPENDNLISLDPDDASNSSGDHDLVRFIDRETSDNRNVEDRPGSLIATNPASGNWTQICTIIQDGKVYGFATIDRNNKVIKSVPLPEGPRELSPLETLRHITTLISPNTPEPPDFVKMGITSAFLLQYPGDQSTHSEEEIAAMPKVFKAGFNNRIFGRSARLRPSSPPKLVRYELEGNYVQFKDFHSCNSMEQRDAAAWKALVENALPQPNEVVPLSFEILATDFFNGDLVREPNHYENHVTQQAYLNRPSPEVRNHVYGRSECGWKSILQKNVSENDMVLIRFLQDLVLNSHIQEVVDYGGDGRYLGLKVRAPGTRRIETGAIRLNATSLTTLALDLAHEANDALIAFGSSSEDEPTPAQKIAGKNAKKNARRRAAKQAKKARDDYNGGDDLSSAGLSIIPANSSAEEPPQAEEATQVDDLVHVDQPAPVCQPVRNCESVPLDKSAPITELVPLDEPAPVEEPARIDKGARDVNLADFYDFTHVEASKLLSLFDTPDDEENGAWNVVQSKSRKPSKQQTAQENESASKSAASTQSPAKSPSSTFSNVPKNQSRQQPNRLKQNTQRGKPQGESKSSHKQGLAYSGPKTVTAESDGQRNGEKTLDFNVEEYPPLAHEAYKSTTPVREEPVDKTPAQKELIKKQSVKTPVVNQQPTDNESADKKAVGTKTDSTEPVNNEPSNKNPVGKKNDNKELVNNESAILEPVDQKTENKVSDDRKINDKKPVQKEVSTKDSGSNESSNIETASEDRSKNSRNKGSRKKRSRNKKTNNQEADNQDADGKEADSKDADSNKTDSKNADDKKADKTSGAKKVDNKESSKVGATKSEAGTQVTSTSPIILSPKADKDNSLPLSSQVPDITSTSIKDSVLFEKNLQSALATDTNEDHKGEANSDTESDFKIVVWTSKAIIKLLLRASNEETRNTVTFRKSASETDLARLIAEAGKEYEYESDEDASVQRPRGHSMPVRDDVSFNYEPDDISAIIQQHASQQPGSISGDVHHQNPASVDNAAGHNSSVGETKRGVSGETSTSEPHITQQHRTHHTLPAEFAVCTHCLKYPTSGPETQVICPGCGSDHYVRYCSVACLLADAYDHATCCLRRPVPPRLFPTNLPQPIRQSMTTLNPPPNMIETPEKFRQRTFSMFCSTGPFPQILLAWARKMNYNLEATVNGTDWFKKTGDYAIFRSEVTGLEHRFNPNADVIFTVKLLTNDPRKQYLVRVLNACFVDPRVDLLQFLFRLIQALIMDQEYFEACKYYDSAPAVFQEFRHQFEREWGFDPAIWVSAGSFNYGLEWLYIIQTLRTVESENPILSQAWPINYPS